jgi:hypothetical protein
MKHTRLQFGRKQITKLEFGQGGDKFFNLGL